MTSNTSTNHLDYADASEAAERGSAWAQASALWQKAIDLCDDPTHNATYQAGIARCDAAAVIRQTARKRCSRTVAHGCEYGLAR